jgi:transposase InsO family protein
VERLHGRRFQTIREAKDEVIAWLLWYNRTRMHSTLNYVSCRSMPPSRRNFDIIAPKQSME